LAAIVAFGIPGQPLARDAPRQDLSATLSGPGGMHPLATNQFGRDMPARFVDATRLSLGFAAVPAVTLGFIARCRAEPVERALVSLAHALVVVPGLLLMAVFVAVAPCELLPLCRNLSLALAVESFASLAASPHSFSRSRRWTRRYCSASGPGVLRYHLLPELALMPLTLLAFSAAWRAPRSRLSP
jgi:peptide/nickel transport system permease protein